MIKSVQFQNFRGFINLQMDDLCPITLISGMNNVGKSSVLDGIFLVFDHTALESFAKLNNFRGLPQLTDPRHLWEPIFHDFDTQKEVKIVLSFDGSTSILQYSRDDSYLIPENIDVPREVLNQFISSNKPSYTLKFQYTRGAYTEKGHFITNQSGSLRNVDTSEEGNRILPMPYTQFINIPIIHAQADYVTSVGDLELQDKKEELIENLKLIEPSITDITTIMSNGVAQIYLKVNGRLIPLRLAGDGVNKWLIILLSIMAHPSSLLLIDEIETGIHYSAYTDMWRSIAVIAKKYQCQIIATTHSYECILEASNGLKKVGLADDFCYFRIDKNGDKTTARRYSNKLLRTALDTNLEVR